MRNPFIVATLVIAAAGLGAQQAEAHVSVTTAPAFANATQEITFGVGHGCEGADTYSVRIEIPAGVTSVRPLRSDFGRVSIEKDNTGGITGVVWQKATGDALEGDIAYYKLVIRMKLPNQPFTKVYFPTHQTCRAADGSMLVTHWVMLPTDPVVDGGSDEPAPEVKLLPARQPGWNKVTVPVAISDLAQYFADAQIVWKGTAAWSANTVTKDLIASTPGVTALSSLAANDEIWVKY